MEVKSDLKKAFFNLGDLKAGPPIFDHDKLVEEHREILLKIADIVATMAAANDCMGITWFLQSISVIVNGAHSIFPELPTCKGCYRARDCGVGKP